MAAPNKKLTRTEADRLQFWADMYRVRIQTEESEQVFYQAQAGEAFEAILGFGRLMRECQREARLANDQSAYGRAKRKLINEVSVCLQDSAMSYLPLHITTTEEHHLLQQILDNYGWVKKAK